MTVPETLPAALRAAATTYADRPAIVDGNIRLTFAQLHERVRDTARGYRAHGVGATDRVAVWAPNSADWVVHALAVSYAEAELVPLNTRYTGHEVVDLLARTGTRLLVLQDGFLGRNQYAELTAAAAGPAAQGEVGDLATGLPTLAAVVRIGEGTVPGTTSPDELLAAGRQVPVEAIETAATSPISSSRPARPAAPRAC